MRDHETIVRVDIKHEVLIGGSQLGSQAAVPAFEMNRVLIERLASAKYDNSEYVVYANGAVISIDGQDWEPVASERQRTAMPTTKLVGKRVQHDQYQLENGLAERILERQ
jgi:hypothetical protein